MHIFDATLDLSVRTLQSPSHVCLFSRSSDANLATWLSGVLRDSHGKRHEVLQRVLPRAVFDSVFDDNVQFLQDQGVYNVEFFGFVKALLAGVEVSVQGRVGVGWGGGTPRGTPAPRMTSVTTCCTLPYGAAAPHRLLS